MAGPFDRYQSPWFSLRESQNIDDRRDDPWPWHTISNASREEDNLTPTRETIVDRINGIVLPEDIPPVTRLSRDAGASDVEPISKEELLKFLINIESMNPDPSPPVATRELKDVIKRR